MLKSNKHDKSGHTTVSEIDERLKDLIKVSGLLASLSLAKLYFAKGMEVREGQVPWKKANSAFNRFSNEKREHESEN